MIVPAKGSPVLTSETRRKKKNHGQPHRNTASKGADTEPNQRSNSGKDHQARKKTVHEPQSNQTKASNQEKTATNNQARDSWGGDAQSTGAPLKTEKLPSPPDRVNTETLGTKTSPVGRQKNSSKEKREIRHQRGAPEKNCQCKAG